MDDIFSYATFRVDNDGQTVFFDYDLTHNGQTYRLTETLKFPVKLKTNGLQLASLRALHLALGVSYYKIFAGPKLHHPYSMDQQEADFWNNIWRNGLGEFLYVNKLSPDVLAAFNAQDGTTINRDTTEVSNNNDAILGIGGGKDSIVAGELLKDIGLNVVGFVMATGEQLGQAQAVAETMGITLHVVERSLDKQLLELQELPDAYKGHIPISLVFGLVGTALAIALDSSYVVVANEASASIPRITWEYGTVNHQWSKSFEFEQQLQAYIHELIAPDVTYCSAIRQLTSVGVAKIFAGYLQYFEVFTSDNFVFRIDPAKRPNARWSLESPKSLSSFILLAPWLSEEDLLRIFGRNFLDEPTLETLFKELIGVEGEPPLDCVGTVDELVLSLNLAVQQQKFAESHLIELARQTNVVQEKDWQPTLQQMLKLQSDEALPVNLRSTIHDELDKELSA